MSLQRFFHVLTRVNLIVKSLPGFQRFVALYRQSIGKRIVPPALIGCSLVASAGSCFWDSASLLVAQEPAQNAAPDGPSPSDSVSTDSAESTAPVDPNSVDAITAGHSVHGETFDEGPRQAAVLMGGTGDVQFPVTSTVPEVQAFINQGIGQLHGFWYLEAERSFRHAAFLDPHCGIAFWGCAMANVNNPNRAKGFITEAEKYKGECSDRERRYIEALAKYLNAPTENRDEKRRRAEEYIGAIEQIALNYPDDHEAIAFLIFAMWDARRDELGITSHLAVDALLEDLFVRAPNHPAHHYEIHLWDYQKPERALASSAACGPAAPSIAHMWHMPGHIYSRLNRYEDAVYQQEASARVDHAHQMRFALLPDEIHNYAHNNEWLVRNLSFIGRVDDAVSLSSNLIELPRHPKFNTVDGRGSTGMGRERLADLLREHRLWERTLALASTRYLEPQTDERREVERLTLIGCAAAMMSDAHWLSTSRSELQAKIDLARTERDAAIAKALEALATPATPPAPETPPAEGQQAEGQPAATPMETPEAIAEKQKKAEQEAAKPFDERIKRAEDALRAIEGFEAWKAEDFARAHERLKDLNDVHESIRAEVQCLAGEVEEGLTKLREQVDRRPNQIVPVAVQAWVLERLGRRDEAIASLEKLKQTSSCFDLNQPLIARLDSLVQAAGWSGDWRRPAELASDLGARPDLESLGPFRWTPPAAPQWQLVDSASAEVSSQSFQGKPVVVIFYLGAGCLHCVDQLKAFAPKREQFLAQGYDVIAISCEDVESLARSIKDYGDSMPIPLLADPELSTFKAFRCFDDFEQQPMHGTFLIDGSGKIRWKDIGPEPFMDPDFVLNEATRLLSFDTPVSSPTTDPTASITTE